MAYDEADELNRFVEKFDRTDITGLTEKEETSIYNYLRELQEYRRIGSLLELSSIRRK